MNSNRKLNRAKIELHLFTLLENTNKEFTARWKQCQNSNKEPIRFQDCSKSYQKIIELVEYNREKNNISNLLESYYLEARLGQIQSELNDLPQNPPSEDTVMDNDKTIRTLEKSLIDLKDKAKKFSEMNLTNKKAISRALRKDFQDLFNKIDTDSLSKDISQCRAIYLYNHAENLIAELEDTISNSDFDLKIKHYKRAINYLHNSADSYKKAENIEHAEETSQRQKEIEKQLKQLEKSLKPILKIKKISAKSGQSLTLNNASKDSDGSYPIQKKQIELHKDNTKTNFVTLLPLKKRKNWIITEEEPVLKKSNFSLFSTNGTESENLPNAEKSTRKKSYTSPSEIKITFDISLNFEEEAIQHREEAFKKMLTLVIIDDPFRFYGRFFLDLSQQLQICSKESSNHTLLTQLSWLAIAQQLISLIPNKNQTDNTTLKTISDHIRLITSNHKKNLAIISSQKRGEAYPIYESHDLQPKSLQNLLIKEIIDYYYGLEAFKLTAAAISFLDLISHVINKYSFASAFREIENTIQSVHKLNENLFCAKLLRELVKFYICDENANWQNNTFSSANKIDLNKEYLRILIISQCFAEGLSKESQDLRNKIQQLKNHLLQQIPEQDLTLYDNINSSHSFFQQNKQVEPFSTELLIKTLQEHFQRLLKYKAPTIHSNTIYKNLLRFIQTHCKDQAEISYSRSLTTLTMHF